MSRELEKPNLRKAFTHKAAKDMSTDPPIGSPDQGGISRCRAFDVTLGVLIAAVPLSFSFLAPHTLKWAILGVLVPLITALWLWGGCGRSLWPIPKLALPLLGLLLVSMLSLPQAINLHYGLQRIAFLVLLFLLYFTVAYCSQPDRQSLIIRYLLLTLLVVSGVSLSGCLLGRAVGLWSESGMPEIMIMRLLGNTNYGAAYLLTMIPLSFAFYLGAPRRFERALYGGILFLSTMLLTLSMVRGAWITVWIGILVVARVYSQGDRSGTLRNASIRSQMAPLLLIAGAIVGAVVAWPTCLPTSPSVMERVTSAFDPGAVSLQTRLAYWEGTLRMIRDHLWTGVGVGNFLFAFVPYRTPAIYRHPALLPEHPHNEYLNVWAELGPLGVLAFGWLFIGVVRLGWGLLGRSGVKREVLAGILGGLAASAAYANLFYVVHVPASAMNVAILLGLLDGMGREVGQIERARPLRLRTILPGLLVAGLLYYPYFLRPLAGEINYFLALRDFRYERMQDGFSRLERSLEWDPQSYKARYRRATAFFSIGKYPESIEEAQEALHIHPHLEVAYWIIGSAYLKLGDKAEAKAMFLKALDVNPHYPHALNNLGVRALEEGRFAEAEKLFLRALEGLGQSDVSPYVNLANLYEATGHYEAALQMYETAAGIQPKSGATWYHVARLRALNGDHGHAYEDLARAIALDEAWRGRAAKEPAFAALRESDPRVKMLLGPEIGER